MDKDNLEKITVVLANEFLNSFNINGCLLYTSDAADE